MKKIFKGIMPALLTPICEDGSINEDAAAQLIEELIRQGADGFYVLGGTGEGLILERDKREQMCEAAVRCVNGRVPIINHIAAMLFDDAVALARHSEKTGCDAIAAVPPLFFAYSEDDIFKYYKKLADSVSIPVIIYYHPGAQKHMSAELIAKIFQIDNVTGVKWSSNDLFEMMKLKDITNGEMNIINGPDELLLEGLAAGADAGIGSTYNVMLPEFVKIYKLFQEGRMEEAMRVQIKINRVIEFMIKNGVIPSVKCAAEILGFEAEKAVFPQRSFSGDEKAAFREELNKLGWPFREE